MGEVAQPRLFLIDSFGFIFRAYHARARSGAPPMRTSKGLSTEAVYIFNNMLRKLSKSFQPEYIAAVFESGAPTARMEEFPEYKANRAEAPPDLAEQLPQIRRVLEAMRIPILEYPGFEADDVIGTISRRAAEAGMEVVIVSSDKDMLQLVDGGVSMLNPAKDDEWYDAAKVKQFMGVEPGQVTDLLALMGDAIDNIPGAPGIGDKGARALIERFGSVEAAIERAAEVERKTYRESLQNNAERIRMSKRLATLDCSIPIEFSVEAVRAQEPDYGPAQAGLQGPGVPQPAARTGAGRGYARARLRRARNTGGGGCVGGGDSSRGARGGGHRKDARRRAAARYHRPGVAARRGARRAAKPDLAARSRCSKTRRGRRSPAT